MSETVLGATAELANAAILAPNSMPTFSIANGKVTTDFARSGISDKERAYCVALQPDGKILVAGDSRYGYGLDFGLVRYNPDGSLDASFDGDGKIINNIGSQAYSVIVLPDNKILIAGSGAGQATFSMARYNPDGSLDTSFDGDGSVTMPRTASSLYGGTVALQSDGKILVTGTTGGDFFVYRYNSDGSVDTSFDGDGMVRTNFDYTFDSYGDRVNSDDNAHSIVVQSDGKIIVAGCSQSFEEPNNSMDFGLVRYNSDGSLDMSFGTGGSVITDFGSNNSVSSCDFGQSVTLQSDGKILVAGHADKQISNPVFYEFALARYNLDGSLDTSFDGDGKVTTNFGAIYHTQRAQSVTVQSDGKILVAGYLAYSIELNSSYGRFALARYNSDGSLDTSFDGDGKVITNVGIDDYAYSVTVQPDGKILVVGQSSLTNGMSYDFAVVRYNSDGSLDQTFGPRINTLDSSPVYSENGEAVVLDSNVKVYDAELSASGNYAGASLVLQRHSAQNGEDHFSVNNGGTIASLAEGGDLLVDGIVAGHIVSNSGGKLELEFNANATQPIVNSVLQQISYRNSSDAPPSSVQLDWTFSDGNTGSQGTGGPSSTTGNTTIQITALNNAPTLTAFNAPVDSTLENTAVAITLEELKSHGDAADVDGTVDSFVIKGLTTGNLKIGSDPSSATLYNALTNNIIDTSHQVWWTPDSDTKGTLSAFTVVAKDNSGAESTAAVQVTVVVTPAPPPDTTPPTLTTFSPVDGTTGIAIGSNIELTFSEAIQLGSGAIEIHSGSASGTLVASSSVGTLATLLNGSTLTINPTSDLANSTHYFVTLGAGAVKDAANNSYAGTSTYDFTTAAASTSTGGYDLNGHVTFWKTGAAISGATSILTSNTGAVTSPVEFRNIHVAADGTRTIEIWETSTRTDIDSVQLEFTYSTGSGASWQSDSGMPSGWDTLSNTETAGKFILAGIGLSALTAGALQLGTLTLTAPANPQHFELALSSGMLGGADVATFGIVSESIVSGADGLCQHLNLNAGIYILTETKITGAPETSAVKANDALAALKIAVGLNPNADNSAVSSCQYLAADVNKDGQVKASDALGILKMAVGLSSAPEKEWLFVPDSVATDTTMTRNNVVWPESSIAVTLDNQNQELHLIGIVKGDVNGSWAA